MPKKQNQQLIALLKQTSILTEKRSHDDTIAPCKRAFELIPSSPNVLLHLGGLRYHQCKIDDDVSALEEKVNIYWSCFRIVADIYYIWRIYHQTTQNPEPALIRFRDKHSGMP